MEAQQNDAGNSLVWLNNVRLSRTYLYRAFASTSDDGTVRHIFKTHAIMPPGHPGIDLIKAAQRKAAQFAFKEGWESVLTALAGQDKLCLHSGDISQPGEDGYAGNFFVSANAKSRVPVKATRGGVNVDIAENDPWAPYSGSFGNVAVIVWPQYQGKFGKRINAQLAGVQFLRHGDRFGGGRMARTDEFALAPVDADSPMPGSAGGAGIDPALSALV